MLKSNKSGVGAFETGAEAKLAATGGAETGGMACCASRLAAAGGGCDIGIAVATC